MALFSGSMGLGRCSTMNEVFNGVLFALYSRDSHCFRLILRRASSFVSTVLLLRVFFKMDVHLAA